MRGLILILSLILVPLLSSASDIAAKCSVQGNFQGVDFIVKVDLKDGRGLIEATAQDEKVTEEFVAPHYAFFLKDDKFMFDKVIDLLQKGHPDIKLFIEPLTQLEANKVEAIEIQSESGPVLGPSDDLGDYWMVQLLALDRSVVARFIGVPEAEAIGRCK